MKALITAASVVLFSMTQAQADLIEVETPTAPTQALVSREFVEAAIASGQYELIEVTDAELEKAAALNGVSAIHKNRDYGHPAVILKMPAVGIPGGFNIDLEIYIDDGYSLELGAGAGPLGVFYSASVQYFPTGTTWGSRGNQFSISFGGTVNHSPQAEGGIDSYTALVASVDAKYIGRPAEWIGFVAGMKGGFGGAVRGRFFTEFPDRADGSFEYSGMLLFYVGGSFGSRDR